MENNNNGISRRELTSTPFDMLQKQGGDDLGLDDPIQTIVKDEITPNLDDDPNLEPIDDDTPKGEGEEVAGQEPPEEGDQSPEEEENEKPTGEETADDQPPGEEDYEVKVNANLAKYAAEAMISQGALPEDFEITDDITEADLDAAYVNYKEETLRNQIAREERDKLAKEEGLTPEMIEEVKLKYYGVQDPEIEELRTLEYLSTYQFDDQAETYTEDAKAFLTAFYAVKGYPQTHIESIVKTNLESDDLSSIVSEAQTALHDDYLDLDKSLKTRAADNEKALANKRKENKESIVNLLDGGIIDGVQFSQDELDLVKKALFDKTEIVVGPDGKRYRATLYYKKRLEAAQNLEKDLLDKVNFILGGSSKTLKNKEREKTTRKIMNRLNSYVDVSVKKPKKTNKTTSKPKSDTGIQRVEIN